LEYYRFLVRSDNKAIKNAKVGTTMEYQQRGFDLQHFPSKENETSRFSFQETGTEETLQDPESEETLQLLLHDKPDETEYFVTRPIGFLLCRPKETGREMPFRLAPPDIRAYTLFVRPMQLSHKTTEALTDSSASKTFHE
jgi:hypothetical protein